MTYLNKDAKVKALTVAKEYVSCQVVLYEFGIFICAISCTNQQKKKILMEVKDRLQ